MIDLTEKRQCPDQKSEGQPNERRGGKPCKILCVCVDEKNTEEKERRQPARYVVLHLFGLGMFPILALQDPQRPLKSKRERESTKNSTIPRFISF